MGKFVEKEYIDKFIRNDSHEKTHIEVFFEFVSHMIFGGDEYTIEDFALLNAEELKESLVYYIKRNRITAKQTANAYLGNLKKFFANLEVHFQIHNDVYVNGSFVSSFIAETEKTICTLSDAENTDTATDDEYQELMYKIAEAENLYSFEQAISEIDNYFSKRTNDTPSNFQRILSICASRMVIEYGLSNRVMINIKIDDIDLENRVIKLGKYTLPLPISLMRNLEEYLKVRSYLLSKQNKTQEVLFILCNGDQIKIKEASGKLFTKVVGENASKESKPYAKRCIERMVREGLSSDVIKEITGYGDDIYKAVCNFVNKEQYIQSKLTELIIPTNNINVQRKGYINCPKCGKETKAISDELILIKYPNDSTRYLLCRSCGEKEKAKYGGKLNE